MTNSPYFGNVSSFSKQNKINDVIIRNGIQIDLNWINKCSFQVLKKMPKGWIDGLKVHFPWIFQIYPTFFEQIPNSKNVKHLGGAENKKIWEIKRRKIISSSKQIGWFRLNTWYYKSHVSELKVIVSIHFSNSNLPKKLKWSHLCCLSSNYAYSKRWECYEQKIQVVS